MCGVVVVGGGDILIVGVRNVLSLSTKFEIHKNEFGMNTPSLSSICTLYAMFDSVDSYKT